MLPYTLKTASASIPSTSVKGYLDTFLFFHAIKRRTLKSLKSSCREDGLVARVPGNTGSALKHAITFEKVKQVVSFITNYAKEYAIQLPGCIPGYKRSNLPLLPCSTTKYLVWPILLSS